MAISEAQRRYRASPRYRETLARYRLRNRERLLKNSARYRAAHPGRVSEKNKAAGERLRKSNPAKALLYSARGRAKRLGCDCTIGVADINMPEVCPVFGVPFDRGNGPRSATLDRIQPDIGYVPGNVQVLSRLANQMKSAASREQLLAFARWVLETAP